MLSWVRQRADIDYLNAMMRACNKKREFMLGRTAKDPGFSRQGRQ